MYIYPLGSKKVLVRYEKITTKEIYIYKKRPMKKPYGPHVYLTKKIWIIRRWMIHLWMSPIERLHWVMSHIWVRNKGTARESRWVMSHTWMSHVTLMNESCHTHEWVHMWTCVCHTYVCAMAPIWVSESCHVRATGLLYMYTLKYVTHMKKCRCHTCNKAIGWLRLVGSLKL